MTGWLDDKTLERSSVVANSLMNRQRGAVGVNSYERELRFDPIMFLSKRIESHNSAAWLDLCCGRGCALIEAAERLQPDHSASDVWLHGIDLVDMFDAIPAGVDFVKLEPKSLSAWVPRRKYDLITCVHGLHYIGDKLGLLGRCLRWLTRDGKFIANIDLTNLCLTTGQPPKRRLLKRLRACGLDYNARRHLLSCVGPQTLQFDLRYVGADDRAGPNYSGQDAVDSYYEPLG